MEQQIKIAAKLYECRNSAKMLYKEQFKTKLKPYIHLIKSVMKANNLKETSALLKISETYIYQESGVAQMMFMAAVCELLEPIENKIS